MLYCLNMLNDEDIEVSNCSTQNHKQFPQEMCLLQTTYHGQGELCDRELQMIHFSLRERKSEMLGRDTVHCRDYGFCVELEPIY